MPLQRVTRDLTAKTVVSTPRLVPTPMARFQTIVSSSAMAEANAAVTLAAERVRDDPNNEAALAALSEAIGMASNLLQQNPADVSAGRLADTIANAQVVAGGRGGYEEYETEEPNYFGWALGALGFVAVGVGVAVVVKKSRQKRAAKES